MKHNIPGAIAPERSKIRPVSIDSMLHLFKNASKNYVDLFHIVNSCLIFCLLSLLGLLLLLLLKFHSVIEYVGF